MLHQLFEQILYIPLIVFSFLHQPTDTICLIPLLQKLGERPIECGLPPLDHAAILLHGICCFADGQPLGKAFPEEVGVFIVGSAATDGALRVLVINISEGLALRLRKAILIHLADGAFVDLAPGLTDVFIPQHTIDFDLLAEGGVADEVVMFVVLAGKAGILAATMASPVSMSLSTRMTKIGLPS